MRKHPTRRKRSSSMAADFGRQNLSINGGVSQYWKMFCLLFIFISVLIILENIYTGHLTESFNRRTKIREPLHHVHSDPKWVHIEEEPDKDPDPEPPSPYSDKASTEEEEDEDGTEKIETENDDEGVCHIPQLTVWNDVTKKYWKTVTKLDCTKNPRYPPIFTTDLDSTLIRLQDPIKFNLTYCCYREILTNFSDSEEMLVRNCIPITQNRTLIPERVEAFRILCKNLTVNRSSRSSNERLWPLVDVLGFPRAANRHTMTRIHNYDQWAKKEDQERVKPNLIIFGIDSCSRMNLQRILPKTFKYITQKLGAVGMHGYTKIGLNTLPNIVPALSGKLIEELEQLDDRNKLVPLLAEHLVWKKFEEEGYITSYLEDASWAGVFTYRRKGFLKPPADFYGRPQFRQAEIYAGHERQVNYDLCYASHSCLDYMFDYMKKVSRAMDKINQNRTQNGSKKMAVPYFKMAWASALFHDYMHLGQMADDDILQMVKWYKESASDQMNNTILIMMSDHGDRFGSMRMTSAQGRIEERMPFVYFIFPPWFHQTYKKAVANMRDNLDRLTAHLDLHETLVDLTNLNQISDTQITKRGVKLREKLEQNEYPRGISLFLPIPKKRSCNQTGIPDVYCVCSTSKNLDLGGPQAKPISRAVETAINFINTQFEKHHAGHLCSVVTLHNISIAQQLHFDFEEKERDKAIPKSENFRVGFFTQPGLAFFEAELRRPLNSDVWTLEGTVDRLNSYGNQSFCVSENWRLKPICFCKPKK